MTIPEKRPKRCQMVNCRKRLMLSDMVCRCNKYFCSLHRLPEQHECNYNYKAENNDTAKRDTIDSMKCVNDRIEKI